MSSKYGRVAQPDKIPISTPSDALEYRDDINGNGYNRNGNGIYNDPVYTIDMSPKSHRDTFRIGCFKCRNTTRNKFMLFGAVLVVLLVVILIIVAASHAKSSGSGAPMAPGKTSGLVAYGPDENGVMRFNPADSSTYLDELHRMEGILHDYSAVEQFTHTEKYMKCHDNMTSIPKNKVCMQTSIEFGERCHNFNLYGLSSGQPCVLLVLKLKDEIPVALDTYNDAVSPERYSNMSVSISCSGKTEQDNIALGVGGSRAQGRPVDYNPKTGYPLYYFKLRNSNSDWVDPAVMVQFNDVETHREITVKCVAWAQNFNDGQPQNSPKYSTEFKFDVFN